MSEMTSMPEKFAEIIPEVKNILEVFEFYLVERNLKKPIDKLADVIRDMRIIEQRLLHFFMKLDTTDEELFTNALASDLAERAESVQSDSDEEYVKYCIEQILVPFEWAEEIKLAYADSPEMQKMLAADIPILRPFDYGLQGKMAVLRKSNR